MTKLALDAPDARAGPLGRLFTRRVGGMLVRNTVVSTGVLGISVSVLWLLVEQFGMDELIAAGIGFLMAQTVHYILGRTWIFRGTDRSMTAGYVIFLVNAGVGLALTVGLFAVLLELTSIHYLVARVIVSIFAGLAMFVLNATLNFRRV